MMTTTKIWFRGFFTCALIVSLGLNVVLLHKEPEIKYSKEQQARMDALTASLERK